MNGTSTRKIIVTKLEQPLCLYSAYSDELTDWHDIYNGTACLIHQHTIQA